MSFTIHQGVLGLSDVQALLELHVAQMRTQSPPDACHVLGPEALDRADIIFFSLRESGRLLGVGALRVHPGGEGEIKSMRTAPAALGRGVGTALLRAIIEEAQARRMTCLRLETGRTADFAAATALYFKAGFRKGEPFAGYADDPFTRFLCLDLPVRLASISAPC